MGVNKTYLISLVVMLLQITFSQSYAQDQLGVRVHEEQRVYDGYTLITPSNSHKSYLINNCGEVINEWESPNMSETATYLTKEGNLIKTCISEKPTGLQFYGQGGLIQMWSWDDELLWSHDFNSDTETTNHDIALMPNGNILVLFSRLVRKDKTKELGRIHDLPIYATVVKEVKMVGTSEAEVIWEWDVTDHLIQDAHADKENYGVIKENPDRVNINYEGKDPRGKRYAQNPADIFHANGIDYNVELDQILITLRNFSEVWVIDHSTTTAEAKGSSGGRSEKGGRLLYRYGNPEAYNAGDKSNQVLHTPHAGRWKSNEANDQNEILVFNNCYNRSVIGDYGYSEVLNVSFASRGSADREGKIIWEYGGTQEDLFGSKVMSNAEILPNGNVLINTTQGSLIQEITPEKEKVWDYIMPTEHDNEIDHGGALARHGAFIVTKYPKDMRGFEDKDLSPKRGLGLFEVNGMKCQSDINKIRTQKYSAAAGGLK